MKLRTRYAGTSQGPNFGSNGANSSHQLIQQSFEAIKGSSGHYGNENKTHDNRSKNQSLDRHKSSTSTEMNSKPSLKGGYKTKSNSGSSTEIHRSQKEPSNRYDNVASNSYCYNENMPRSGSTGTK